MTAERAPFAEPWSARAALAFVLIVTAVRIVALVLTPIDLHGDEAQYWAWSRHLDWGYFSKPPLIAWIIAASTSVFGNDEWAVRLAAPLAQGAAAGALYALARALYGHRAGLWALIGWALMPGVVLSSVLISTDALLLPLWAISLLCLQRLVATNKAGWALALGLSFGLGVMAKYAMFYFLFGAALAAVMAPTVRRALASRNGGLALAIAAAVIAPNLFWNAQHQFDTIAHTASNAGLGGDFFNPGSLAIFWAEQFGVAGPIQFALLVALLVDAARRRKALSETDRFLLAFVAPALAIISVQALLNRANSNWAAAAFPAAIVWIAGRFAHARLSWLLKASAGLHALIATVFLCALVSPGFADAIGLANAFKRARSWEETAAVINARVREAGQVTAVLVDNRLVFYDLNYYWRETGPPAPLRMWLLEEKAANSAEQSAPLKPSESGRVFVAISNRDYRDFLFDDFVDAAPAGEVAIALGGGKTRKLSFALASALMPAPRDETFKAKLKALRNED